MPVEISNTTCHVCGKEAGLMCQRCAEPYCNDVCQREDWQRHKHVCIVMPPLVANSGFKRNNGETKLEKCTIKNKEISLVPLPLSKNWREHILPPEGVNYFECRVTRIDENGSLWVIDTANEKGLESLSENMIEAMRKSKPYIRIKDVSVDALVGVVVDGKSFRARVLALNPKKLKQAELFLIDYGRTFTTSIANIYSPFALMAESKAFAFCVKLSNNNDVMVNKHINIRLLGTKTHEGIYHAQLKPKIAIPMNLPVKLLQEHPNVGVVHIFESDSSSNSEPQVALLQIKTLDNLNVDLNQALLLTTPLSDGMTTLFVAASTNRGYRRAFLLDFFEEPIPRYLVYEVDEGRVFITRELRRIPSDLMVHPMRVFALTMTEGFKGSLKEALLHSSANDLTVKFKPRILHDTPEELRTAGVTLLGSDDQRICEGRGTTFLGQLGDLGLKYWLDPFTSGQLVFITRVISHDKIYISSVETKKYAEIFHYLEAKCKPFSDLNEIIIGGVVLVICPTQNNFRGEVTELLGNGKYTVRNIDTGHELQVTAEMLRTSCRFIENMPVSLKFIKLKNISEIPSVAVPPNNAAYEMLQVLSTQSEDEWLVNFIDDNCEIGDLLSPKDKKSLVSILLPLIFTSGTMGDKKPDANMPPPTVQEVTYKVSLEASNLPSLPPSPTSSCKPVKITKTKLNVLVAPSVKRFYYKDMQRIMIPLCEKLEIMLLNSMGVHKTGYVTACHFPNDAEVQKFLEVLDLVQKFGKDKKTQVAGYVPEVGEMCATQYRDDMEWYRGVCQEICGDMLKILYFDFGNIDIVPLDWVKPMSGDMLTISYSNKCYIKGFDKDKNFDVVEKYLIKQTKLVCDIGEGPEPNTRYLSIPNLDKILSKEIS